MSARAALALAVMMLAGAPLSAQEATRASGGMLRVLDKTTGVTTDLPLADGETAQVGGLSVRLDQCRYPAGNPNGDAFAELEIRYRGIEGAIFSGWMVASSPALNALDHPRFDVWVLRCTS